MGKGTTMTLRFVWLGTRERKMGEVGWGNKGTHIKTFALLMMFFYAMEIVQQFLYWECPKLT
jgi:hypothetical protein